MSKIDELIANKFFPDQLENLGITDILFDLMQEYAEFCMNKLKDEIFIYGSYEIHDEFGTFQKETEYWIENFKH